MIKQNSFSGYVYEYKVRLLQKRLIGYLYCLPPLAQFAYECVCVCSVLYTYLFVFRHGLKYKALLYTGQLYMQDMFLILFVPTETPPPAYHSISEVGSPVPSEHSLMDQLSPGVGVGDV